MGTGPRGAGGGISEGSSSSQSSASRWSSSSSSSGGDYSPSSSGYDYSSSGSSSSGGGGAIKGEEVFSLLLIFGFILWIVVRKAKKGRALGVMVHGDSQPAVDVTVLRFALDARTRPFVQKELDRIAKSADVRTA